MKFNKDDLQKTVLVAAGAVGHRAASKVADKLVQKASPTLAAKPVYRYGKEGALALLGILGPSLLKGKNKQIATSIGVGLASDAILSIISQVSGGRLAGDEELLAQSYTATPISAYLPATNYVEPNYLPAEPQKQLKAEDDDNNDNYKI